MGLLDIFNDPYQPSASSGTAGLLSPEDKLMALFSGLSGAGMAMAQPGMSKGQALAMGLGGLGQGIAHGRQSALQQRLLEERFADSRAKKLAQERFATMLAGGANGPRADVGGGINPEHRQVMAALASIDPGAAATMYGKAMEGNKPKDQLIEVNGKLFNVSDPSRPVQVANAQRPQQNLGQLLEEQKAYAPGSPEYNAYQSAIQQVQIKDGFRVGADGGMSSVRGGPADPRYLGTKAGAEAWGRAPATVAINNAQDYTLGEGQTRMRGSPLGLMPGYGLPPSAPRVGAQSSSAPPAPAASQPPGVPPGAIASIPKPASDGERKWREELKSPINQATDLVTQNNIIKTALAKGDGTGDIAAIVAFNKLLDPGAVVREADVQLTLAAQGLADRIAVWAQNKREGDILPPALRQKMAELSDQIYRTSAETIKARVMPYQSVIEGQGGAFGNVVPEDLQRALGWLAPSQPDPNAWRPVTVPPNMMRPKQSGYTITPVPG